MALACGSEEVGGGSLRERLELFLFGHAAHVELGVKARAGLLLRAR